MSYTAASDRNNLLGRPNQYIAKSNWHDGRDSNANGTYSIEAFASAADLAARKTYIQSVTKGVAFLCEYDSAHGLMLLRISCTLTPDQEKQYESAIDS